jgi:hypothetical protein
MTLHDDRPFQHVDKGVRIVSMDGIHSSGRIVDDDHQHLLSGHVSEILLHEGDHNGLRCGARRLCELRAASENKRRSKNLKV